MIMNKKIILAIGIAFNVWASEDTYSSSFNVSPVNEEISSILLGGETPELIKARADTGDPMAQIAYGNILYRGDGVEPNDQLGYFYMLKAAEQGVAEAIFNCAQFLSVGHGVEYNISKSFQMMKQAADLGFLEGMFLCGDMYLKGEGVKKNKDAAYFYFYKAAQRGHKEAQGMCQKMREENF
ncbi:MAG: hypothetical protein NEHIOOID_00877 [Holosporales bacterium]